MTMSNNIGHFGDTTLTKVFVGGLAWETPKEAMREHFEKYGEILEAVIISDKVTGRSKGYGFVTFKEAEAAKKACEDATPVINGRRANCNLASLGARRPRSSSSTPPQHGSNAVHNITSTATTSHVHWYYPAAAQALPFHHQHHHAVPFYSYSPSYVAAGINYNHKLSYTSGAYMSSPFSQVYPGQHVVGANSLMPMYPFYHYHHHHHQSQAMGHQAHILPSTAPSLIATGPALISKPASMAHNAGTAGTPESF